MRRYLVFYGDSYYPGGGWNDFGGDFDTLTEAYDYLATVNSNWAQIVDTNTKMVTKFNRT